MVTVNTTASNKHPRFLLLHFLCSYRVAGNAVNLAARMEQTSLPNKIRVTESFHNLVSDVEASWDEYKVISVKNMGEIGTYLLDPLKTSGAI